MQTSSAAWCRLLLGNAAKLFQNVLSMTRNIPDVLEIVVFLARFAPSTEMTVVPDQDGRKARRARRILPKGLREACVGQE